MAHDVFISYASEDKAVAAAVCASLEGKKIRCWIAPRDVQPGVPYGEAIVEAIQHAPIMVLLFSSKANESPQVMREVERAVSKGVVIIPFRLQDVLPSKSMEYFLSSPHWLDALVPPLDKHIEYLATTVQMMLARLRGGDVATAVKAGPSRASSAPASVAAPAARAPSRAGIWVALLVGMVLLVGLGIIVAGGAVFAWKSDLFRGDKPQAQAGKEVPIEMPGKAPEVKPAVVEELKPLAPIKHPKGLLVELLSVKADKYENLVVRWRYTNLGKKPFQLVAYDGPLSVPLRSSGTWLFYNDIHYKEGGVRQNILKASDGNYDATPVKQGVKIGVDETFEIWAKFPLPPRKTGTITIHLPDIEPFEDVPFPFTANK